MQEILGEGRELFSAKFFPFEATKRPSKRYLVTIGLGGNVGDVVGRFQKIFLQLKKHREIEIVKSSILYRNPPFGYLEQDEFVNSALVLSTNLSYRAFFSYIMYLERRFGRVRTFKNAPRKIDLDIIFFDKIVLKRDWLEIPHPKWSERDSVLVPIFYLEGIV